MRKQPISRSKWNCHIAKLSSSNSSEPIGTEELAFIILKTAKESNLTCHVDPAGVASAACYIASLLVGEKMTIKRIAEIAKVAPKTIKNRYKYLTDNLLSTIAL